MLHIAISLRALVFVLLLGVVVLTGSDVAHSAPAAALLTDADGLVFANTAQNGSRDIRTTVGVDDNIGGIRIYADSALSNPPATAALQFYGNGHTGFPGQAFIDSGSHAGAAILFRTAASGGVAERMRITAQGHVGIGTSTPGMPLHVRRSVGSEDEYTFAATNVNGNGFSVRANGNSFFTNNVEITQSLVALGNGFFDGQLTALGDIFAASGCVKNGSSVVIAGSCPSDERLKRNIEPLNPMLSQLSQLQPVRFDWRTEQFPELRLGTERDLGLIAQQVEEIIPALVGENKDGYKVVHYEQLPVLLLEGVKELKAENDALREENAGLAARLAAIEQRLNGGTVPLVAAR